MRLRGFWPAIRPTSAFAGDAKRALENGFREDCAENGCAVEPPPRALCALSLLLPLIARCLAAREA
jgi:hypothetical protein